MHKKSPELKQKNEPCRSSVSIRGGAGLADSRIRDVRKKSATNDILASSGGRIRKSLRDTIQCLMWGIRGSC
ncbi:MAG: hypothetical protein WC124_07165 [Desulfoplanes sp.]|nr:hypothetical protein [Desulfoplanes sp.]